MSIEEQRKAYDRRQRAWVYLVIGALVGWGAIGGVGSDSAIWRVVGIAVFCGALASVIYGLILFQKPRP